MPAGRPARPLLAFRLHAGVHDVVARGVGEGEAVAEQLRDRDQPVAPRLEPFDDPGQRFATSLALLAP